MTSFTSYSGSFFSAAYLISLDLSHLASLSLTSPLRYVGTQRSLYNFGSRPMSMAQVTSTLIALLDKTPELVRLQVDLGYFCASFDHTVPPVTILKHLPSKIQSLSVIESNFFTSLDLLRFLSSPARSSRLVTLGLPLGDGDDWNETALDLCRDRAIEVTFHDWM